MFSSLNKKRSTASPKPQAGKIHKSSLSHSPPPPQRHVLAQSSDRNHTTTSQPEWTLIQPVKPPSTRHRSHSTLVLSTPTPPKTKQSAPSTPKHTKPPRLPTPSPPISKSIPFTPLASIPLNPEYTPSDWAMLETHTSPSRPGLRKSRQNPTLNLILAGARDTGKTSFVSSLFGSFGAYAPEEFDERVPTKKFREYSAGSVVGLTGERVVLTVVDTPGLEIQSNDELIVEHQVNQIIHYLEDKFEGSLHLERQVKREPVRLGDTHLHCCLYFLHPSVLEPAQRAFQTRSELTQAQMARMKMASMDIRAMRRIAKRANVFPVIGRADELTVSQLNNVRTWIRTEMKGQAVDLSVLTGTPDESSSDSDDVFTDTTNASTPTSSPSNSIPATGPPPPAPKPRRALSAHVSSATTRRVRMNLNINRAEEQLSTMLPLALISAEEQVEALGTEAVSSLNKMNPLSGPEPKPKKQQEDGWVRGFMRRFRWGTIDILDPNHCDFVLLRAVLLGTHLARLKDSTLEKYETYRTEKLIRRERFTKILSPEEKSRLMREMDTMVIPQVAPLRVFSTAATPTTITNKPNIRDEWVEQAGPIVR